MFITWNGKFSLFSRFFEPYAKSGFFSETPESPETSETHETPETPETPVQKLEIRGWKFDFRGWKLRFGHYGAKIEKGCGAWQWQFGRV